MRKPLIVFALLTMSLFLFGCGSVNQENAAKKVDQQEQLNTTVYQNNSNPVINADANVQSIPDKQTDAKIIIANEGTYTSDKGMIITIPAEWDKIVEIREDANQIALTYIGIPNRRFVMFSIACYSHEKYDSLLLFPERDSEFYRNSQVGQNQKYIFCLFTTISTDLTREESEKYAKEIPYIYMPTEKIKERLKIISL